MRKFRPESWQKQARWQSDALYFSLANGDYNNESELVEYFARGYTFYMCKQRRKYVEQRAAKRLGRLIRKGNKK
jgi:hypothetical protein